MVRVIKGLFDKKGNQHTLEVCDYTEREHVTRSIYRDSLVSTKFIASETQFENILLFAFLHFIVDGEKVKTLFYDPVIGFHDGKNKI